VYGRSPEECLRKYNEKLGLGTIRVREGSIAEFAVLSYIPWIETQVGIDTFNRYDHSWRTIVGPALGNRRFSELTPAIVQKAFSDSSLGGSTQQSAKTVLLGIIKLAITECKAKTEHLTMVQMIKIERPQRKFREDVVARADAMLEAATKLGHWTESFIFIAGHLGLRKGELCALKVTDLDRAKQTLTIGRQRNHTQGERDRLKGRKRGANRVIGLPHEIMDKILGYIEPGSIYVITNDKGLPPATNHFERHLEEVENLAGVKMTPHDFRSAAICRMIDSGFTDHEIEEIVGHGDREMILWYRDQSASRSRTALKKYNKDSG
jgi:integrase